MHFYLCVLLFDKKTVFSDNFLNSISNRFDMIAGIKNKKDMFDILFFPPAYAIVSCETQFF